MLLKNLKLGHCKGVMSQLHSHKLQLSRGSPTEEAETQRAVPAQVCESWPIRADWGALKRQALKTASSESD